MLKPVHSGERVLVFELDGLEPTSVTRVAVHIRALRHRIRQTLAARYAERPAARRAARRRMLDQLHRPVRLSAVRRAAEAGGRLRLSKPKWGGTGQMELRTESGTTITSGPSGTISTDSVSFGFSSVAEGAAFQCRLDSTAWSPCSSPKGYADLAEGDHVFEVQATDAAGTPQAPPATRAFTVSTAAPIFNIDNLPGPSWNVFSSLSPWNTKIDRSRVAPNSSVMISKLLGDGDLSPITPTTNRNWGTPIYYATASDPLYRLELSGSWDYTRAIDGAQIHVPAGAAASQGSDSVIWIVDQADGFVYALQRTQIDHSARVITALKGGFRLDSEGLGFSYPSEPPTGVQPIRPEELAAGYVNHAISMGARCLSGHPVAPFDQSKTVGKTCSGDTNPATTRLSMGSVVFLDMSHAQIDALGAPIWQEAILKGLADYGAVVGLNSGAAWAFKFENRIDRTILGEPDPYTAAGLPEKMSFADALDEVGGWEAKLKVQQPLARPCSGIC